MGSVLPLTLIGRRMPLRSQAIVVAVALSLGVVPAPAHEGHKHHDQTVKRSIVSYEVPRVDLVRDDGLPVTFERVLQGSRPIYLNFIFTSCTSVCPVMSQVFSQLQEALGADAGKVDMVSMSIDPEYDTPKRLAHYARQFDAGPQWRFYTSTADAAVLVQKAFDVYSRDKMSHPVVTFYRPAPGQPWTRFDGFATPAELAAEYSRCGP